MKQEIEENFMVINVLVLLAFHPVVILTVQSNFFTSTLFYYKFIVMIYQNLVQTLDGR